MKIVRNWALAYIAGLLILTCFGLAWTYTYPKLYPLVILQKPGEFIPSTAYRGEMVQLCRDFEFTHIKDLTVYRMMTSERPDGREFNMPLDTINVHRAKRYVSQCRLIRIPEDLPTGVWTLHTSITYKSWPFWNISEDLPEVQLTVL